MLRGRWTESECRDWIKSNDPENLSRFDLLLEESRRRTIPFVGSVRRAKRIPAGSFQVSLDSTGEVGHLYVYHYTVSSTTLELSFTRVPKVAASPADVRRFDGFLSALGDIDEFRAAADTLKESGWKRRPNVPLTDVSTEVLQRLVEALYSARSEGAPAS